MTVRLDAKECEMPRILGAATYTKHCAIEIIIGLLHLLACDPSNI